MPSFTAQERAHVRQCASDFQNLVSELGAQISGQLAVYSKPQEFIDLYERINFLQNELGKMPVDGPIDVDEKANPTIKLIILTLRRQLASRLDVSREKTAHPHLLHALDEKLAPFESLMKQAWFRETPTLAMPRLTDFLTLEVAQTLHQVKLEPRKYDEKFHTLQAPNLLTADLHFFREMCALRGNSLALAYLDIDDFKRFNTEYGEPTIDRDLLPVFMRCLEAFSFARGYSYRLGGDEYAILLTSIEKEAAMDAFDKLREKIQRLRYRGIADKTTVSIGLYHVTPDCPLTDREIVDCANAAKKVAKANGKNRLKIYEEMES